MGIERCWVRGDCCYNHCAVAAPYKCPDSAMCSVTGVEGDDEAVLNMVMHSLGSLRPSNTLTGSVATELKAEDYPPEGSDTVLRDFRPDITVIEDFVKFLLVKRW